MEITLEIKMQDVKHDVRLQRTISNEGVDNECLF
jgi:hypothetical protein